MSKSGRRRLKSQGPRVDPLISYLVFAGIGVGTWQMSRPWRQTLLWLVLLGAFLLYAEARPIRANFHLPNVGWGALIGAIVGAPLLAFAWVYLYGFAMQLFATQDVHLLLYQLCLLAAPVEELYFRGFVHRERGMYISVALYTGAALVYFLPGLHVPLLGLVVVTIAYALLGFVHSYLYARHGLSTAITSHLVINLVALVLPFFIEHVTGL